MLPPFTPTSPHVSHCLLKFGVELAVDRRIVLVLPCFPRLLRVQLLYGDLLREGVAERAGAVDGGEPDCGADDLASWQGCFDFKEVEGGLRGAFGAFEDV